MMLLPADDVWLEQSCDAGNSIMRKSTICNWALSLDALNVMAAHVSSEPLIHPSCPWFGHVHRW